MDDIVVVPMADEHGGENPWSGDTAPTGDHLRQHEFDTPWSAASVSSTLSVNLLRKENRMGILGWIFLGLIAGAIAKTLHPGDDPGGVLSTMLVGVLGAILGGAIASALGLGGIDSFFSLGTWLVAILGSLLLLVIYHAVTGGRTRDEV